MRQLVDVLLQIIFLNWLCQLESIQDRVFCRIYHCRLKYSMNGMTTSLRGRCGVWVGVELLKVSLNIVFPSVPA